MLRSSGRAWVTLAVCAAACAGKAEHGSGASSRDAAPVQKPAAGPANAGPDQAEPRRHLLMVLELEPAARHARVLSARSVDLPLPKRRGKPRTTPWRVDVVSATGQVLYSAPQEDTATIRGEFREDQSGELRGVTAQKPVAALTLRLPWLAGASEVRLVRVDTSGEQELGRVAYRLVKP